MAREKTDERKRADRPGKYAVRDDHTADGHGLSPMRRLASIIIALLMSLSLGGGICAYAYTAIDTDSAASVTISYQADTGSMSGVSFGLYKVADVSRYAKLSLCDDFKGSNVDLGSAESMDDWDTLATTFKSYVAANDIAATVTGETDNDGEITFDGLSLGLYLLVGDESIIGDSLYTPAASMILLPTLNDTDEWDYTPRAEIKYEKGTLQEYTQITVKKSWDDNDYSGRPDSVSVNLLRDGEVIESATLSEENDWKCAWSDLAVLSDPAGGVYTYTVEEVDVPDGYTAKVAQEGYEYTIINSYESGDEGSGGSGSDDGSGGSITPGGSAGSGSSGGTYGSGGTSGTPGSSNSSGTSSKLPQTGQLNWPIPYLITGGLILICLGMFLRRKSRVMV